MKATRHNGQWKARLLQSKHNDRQFDISHSEHIDGELALQNVYWDCYGGRRTSAETQMMRALRKLSSDFITIIIRTLLMDRIIEMNAMDILREIVLWRNLS